MSRPIILICAYRKEASPLIDHYQLKSSSSNVWEKGSLRLILTGRGKVAAAAATQKYGIENALFINVGVCGHKEYPIGSVFLAHKVKDPLSCFYPQLLHRANFQSAALQTVDLPTTTYDEETLYDMEASGIFHVALSFSTIEYIHAVKVVSDNEAEPFDHTIVPYLMQRTIPCIDELIALVPEKELPPNITEEYDTLVDKYHFSATERHKLRDVLEKKALFEPKKQKLPL